jgi:hypothetical protein
MTKLRFLPFILLPLCVVSCGQAGHVGKYSFQMGKNSGSHLLVSMTLTNDDYRDDNNVTVGKKAKIYGEAVMGAKASASQSLEPVVSEVPEADVSGENASTSSMNDFDIGETIFGFLDKGLSIDAYYNVGETLDSGRKFLSIGLSLEFIKEITGQSLVIPEEIMSHIVYSEIDDKSIFLTIPVSMDDFFFQLYWYGVDFANFDNEPKEHDVNTHPTAEEIAEINKTYPDTHDGKKYRDYHVFSIALLKE